MADVVVFAPGGYRYLESVFQFSGGVAAEPGYAIERVRLPQPVPLADGFAMVEEHLRTIGRPTTAFCACELRSPAPFSEQGFVDFNLSYVETLRRWGVYNDGSNPVARTNVCPEVDKPAEPSLHAFAYTVPAERARPTFVISGGAEAREGDQEYRDSIVALDDTSLGGLRDKIGFVRAEQERRLGALGFSWSDAVDTRAYCVHDIGPLIRSELVEHGVGAGGLTWYSASPPVQHCEYEMDARTVARNLVL